MPTFFYSQAYLFLAFSCDACTDSDRPSHQIPNTAMIVLKSDRPSRIKIDRPLLFLMTDRLQ